ncbi:aldo/keto reductase [bacterium]|nr:aldo/keto reductase [candidate division CSSED10-310 bacterium]
MKYTRLGATGRKISRLGMGCMRLPLTDPADYRSIDKDRTAAMFEELLDGGVNYFDTAYPYHEGASEEVVGELLAPRRREVLLATKSPGWLIKKPEDVRRYFDEQLTRLRTDYIDFYYLHGINRQEFEETDQRGGWLKECTRLREEGLVRHLCFSFHGPPEDMIWLAESGLFEAVLCQYSLLDQSNERGIATAHELGLWVLIMGPVGGGRITEFGPQVIDKLQIDMAGRARLALQFVWSNPGVDVAVSGMSSLEQVRDNLEIERRAKHMEDRDLDAVRGIMTHLKSLGRNYCTACRYCMPCPQGVNIPLIFSIKIGFDVYGMEALSRDRYDQIGTIKWMPGAKAGACIRCGECEPKCPQKIPIIEQLRECAELFEGT